MSPGKDMFLCLTVCPVSHLQRSFISEVIEALGKRPLHCDCSRVSQVNKSQERGFPGAEGIRHGGRGKEWDQSSFFSPSTILPLPGLFGVLGGSLILVK